MSYAKEELLACAVARLIGDARHVAIGAASPIPATGAFLLKQKNPSLRISLLAKRVGNPFTAGSRELFDLAGQGRIDVFFLGGAQIDGEANINLVEAEGKRFPGSFGSAYMYFAAGKTILFVSHSAAAVQTICRRVCVLDRGELRYDGDVDGGLTEYRRLNATSPNAPVGAAADRQGPDHLGTGGLLVRAGEAGDEQDEHDGGHRAGPVAKSLVRFGPPCGLVDSSAVTQTSSSRSRCSALASNSSLSNCWS